MEEVICVGLAFLAGVMFVMHCLGCTPAADAAAYESELLDCNAESKSLCESVMCENRFRAARGRPLRSIIGICWDAGSDGGK